MPKVKCHFEQYKNRFHWYGEPLATTSAPGYRREKAPAQAQVARPVVAGLARAQCFLRAYSGLRSPASGMFLAGAKLKTLLFAGPKRSKKGLKSSATLNSTRADSTGMEDRLQILFKGGAVAIKRECKKRTRACFVSTDTGAIAIFLLGLFWVCASRLRECSSLAQG